MVHYTCDPNLEVMGVVAIALLNHINSENTYPVIQRHGLTNLDPQAWYPVQRALSVFNDLSAQPGAMWDFVAIGMAAAELIYANQPDQVRQLPFAEYVARSAASFEYFHRNSAGQGQRMYSVDSPAANHLRLTMKVPYPDDLYYGIYYAHARRMLPKGTAFTVKYDENTPRKDLGGKETILHIMW